MKSVDDFERRAREMGGLAIMQGPYLQVDFYVEYDESHSPGYPVHRRHGASFDDVQSAAALLRALGCSELTVCSGSGEVTIRVRGKLSTDSPKDSR